MEFRTKRKGTKLNTYAFEGRKCVGRSIVTLCVFDANTAVITDVFVRDEERCKGYGTELVSESLKKALQFNFIRRILIQDGSEFRQTGKIAAKLGFTQEAKERPAHVVNDWWVYARKTV